MIVDEYINDYLAKLDTLEQVIKSELVGDVLINFYDEEDENRRLVLFNKTSNTLRKYFNVKTLISTAIVLRKGNKYHIYSYISINAKNLDDDSLFVKETAFAVRTMNDEGLKIKYLTPKHDTYSLFI